MKNFSYKSCRKSSKASDEYDKIDLNRDLQGYSKVNSEYLNGDHCFLSQIWKERKILETWLCMGSKTVVPI